MDNQAVIVVDTNVLLNLATPVVDCRAQAPSGEDPFKTVLTGYDVHVPSSVLGEIGEIQQGDDLLAAAAELVLRALDHITSHDVGGKIDDSPDFGLDLGESHCVLLVNELPADMFVTDEFNTTKYLLISLALNDRNILFTTPRLLCLLAEQDILDTRYVNSALTYFVKTKGWDEHYIGQLRDKYSVK